MGMARAVAPQLGDADAAMSDDSFDDVVLLPKLRDSLAKINDWLDDEQIEETIAKIVSLSGSDLLANNQHVLHLLLEGTTTDRNRKTQEISPTVKYIDFDNPDNNSFVAICQFKVRIPGTDRHFIPDITLFLNGLPIAIAECKSPKVREEIAEAIDQMLRYSEQRGASAEGNKKLFYYNQFLIATSRQVSKVSTITARNEKHFNNWSDPYPLTLDELEHGESTPNQQQRLVAGMFAKSNLLSLIGRLRPVTLRLASSDRINRQLRFSVVVSKTIPTPFKLYCYRAIAVERGNLD
jgi:type I restriction enzyme R subunit